MKIVSKTVLKAGQNSIHYSKIQSTTQNFVTIVLSLQKKSFVGNSVGTMFVSL